MVLQYIKRNIAVFLTVALLLIVGGCSSSDSSSISFASGSLLSSEKSELYSSDDVAKVGTVAVMLNGGLLAQIKQNDPSFSTESAIWQDWMSQMSSFTSRMMHGISAHVITYASTDSKGNPVVLSGVAIFPKKAATQNVVMPVFALQRPTIIERKDSPSWSLRGASINPTVFFGLLIASTGYVVVIPDAAGFGSNYDVHPYCEVSAANAVADMVKAISQMPLDSYIVRPDLSRVVLSGYSEGGYVSMIAARLMRKRGMAVTAVAPLSGPYSLSGVMRGVMINADTSFPAPSFLPNTLRAYSAIYGATEPSYLFSNAVVAQVLPEYPDFNKLLYDSLDGSKPESYIDGLMKSIKPYTGPSSIMTPAFLASLSDVNSAAVRILAENNGYYNWVPEMPMKLFHHANDDLVPVANMTDAIAAFGAGVKSEAFTEQLPLSGSVHTNAFAPAMLKGFFWLDSQIYPARN